MNMTDFFDSFVSFAQIFFFYVLPWLLLLLVYAWIKDWAVDIYLKWKRKAEGALAEGREDRWLLIMHVMKIFLFLALLLPIYGIVLYILDDSNADPGQMIFGETMFYVFIVITGFYILATIIQSIYIRAKEDDEQDEADQKKGYNL